jgi:hypothetical protein
LVVLWATKLIRNIADITTATHAATVIAAENAPETTCAVVLFTVISTLVNV